MKIKLKKYLFPGFSLIELLVVISIIGILATLVLTNLTSARARARDAKRKSDLDSINKSLRLYYNDAQNFPLGDSSSGYAIKGCGTVAIPTVCSWGSAFSTTTNVYMGTLPRDPSSTSSSVITYNYYSDGSDTFALIALLENISDPSIAESQANCAAPYAAFLAAGGDQDTTHDYVICAQ